MYRDVRCQHPDDDDDDDGGGDCRSVNIDHAAPFGVFSLARLDHRQRRALLLVWCQSTFPQSYAASSGNWKTRISDSKTKQSKKSLDEGVSRSLYAHQITQNIFCTTYTLLI